MCHQLQHHLAPTRCSVARLSDESQDENEDDQDQSQQKKISMENPAGAPGLPLPFHPDRPGLHLGVHPRGGQHCEGSPPGSPLWEPEPPSVFIPPGSQAAASQAVAGAFWDDATPASVASTAASEKVLFASAGASPAEAYDQAAASDDGMEPEDEQQPTVINTGFGVPTIRQGPRATPAANRASQKQWR